MRRFLERIRELWNRIKPHSPEFLCDTCRYNWRTACRRPERPNAVKCPDYQRK